MRGFELTDALVEPSLFQQRDREVLVSDRPARIQFNGTTQLAITGLEIEGAEIHVQLAERGMGFCQLRIDG